MAAVKRDRNPGRTWRRTRKTSGFWTPSTGERCVHAGVPTQSGLTRRGKRCCPRQAEFATPGAERPPRDMATRGEGRGHNSNRARGDLWGRLHFQTKPGLPQVEGAFLGSGGPPFPGCPTGRVAGGRLAPTGGDQPARLCAPGPCSHLGKKILKKGLSAHSMWVPGCWVGEKQQPPKVFSSPVEKGAAKGCSGLF